MKRPARTMTPVQDVENIAHDVLVLKALRRDTAALANRETRHEKRRFISPARRLIHGDQAGGTMTLSARGWIRNVAGVRVTTSPSISIGMVGSESSTRV